MDTSQSTPGTVYFAISITVLFGLLWRTGGQIDHAPIAAAAAMAMTLGDASASIIGRRWGTHAYTVFGHSRSWEGTAAMASTSFSGISTTLLLLPGSALSPNSLPWNAPTAVLLSLIGTVVATVAEALSPAGADNLSVPLLSRLALYVLSDLV